MSELRTITVTFSEPVTSVAAEYLLINNEPASSVSGSANTYTFSFAPTGFGIVDIAWDEGNAIRDLATPPNYLDANAPSSKWSYDVRDLAAPLAESIVPPVGATVATLSDVEVQFSEEVSGVDASDLFMNGVPAINVENTGHNTYLFHFAPPAAGSVRIEWAANHGIADLATSPNAFASAGWSYTLDSGLPAPRVEIAEFLAGAESEAGLLDEDGEAQDWIELWNSGSVPAGLRGWSLTDDPNEPGLWPLPGIILAPGERLVVFASGKDRRSIGQGARLHTNFRLSLAGEYLGLFNAEAPRKAMTEFPGGYPRQRDDYSYGWDGSGWRYYEKPTPGAPNGVSPIIGILTKPQANVKRGYFDAPFTLQLTNAEPAAVIRYTLDGTAPTASSGFLYTGPLEIRTSTVLRAGAFEANYLPSEIASHTYLFLDQVLRQPENPPGFPTGPTVMGGYPSDYEMDPEVVNDPAYAARIKEALLALPSLSIAMKPDDLFGATKGIYIHPLERGPQWERACSVEFISLDGKDFQADAGIQIQGNSSRDPLKQPKHALRLVFKGDYGEGKLNYRMFPDSPVDSFDTLVLRSDYNFSWTHWNSTHRMRGQRTRDAWFKDSLRAMGSLASHSRYVHLYLNGLYWGIYDPTERPDASFAEAYLGGNKETYDVINEGSVVAGSTMSYNQLVSMGDISTMAQYNAIKRLLDMGQHIDYTLLHFFVGHEDWGNNKNWYAVRPQDGSRGFVYLPWDGETLLGDAGINRVSNPDVASGLHTRLLANEQYRLDFADRVQRHFFQEGALTPGENIARWMRRAREVELPILAESARWGDYRRDGHRYQNPPFELYTRDRQWRAEQGRLLTNYFPGRTQTVLNQLRSAGLYPRTVAPVFSRKSGKVEAVFELSITAPAGQVFYTTNGVDPRIYGLGQLSPEAVLYSQPLAIAGDTEIKARVLSGTEWSALAEASFSASNFQLPLRITEIMYRPAPPGEAGEYLELQNAGSLPFDAAGYSVQGVDYVFPPGSVLQPGQIVVLASSEDPAAFAAHYPQVFVYGWFNGQLSNRGERLALVSRVGENRATVDYRNDSGWPNLANGGYSLEIREPFADPNDPASWHLSAAPNGSPGKPNSTPALPEVRINEILTSPQEGPDWIELLNTSSMDVELSGWRLHESGNTNALIFPPGTFLAPGAFAIVLCDKAGEGEELHAPFALDSEAETVILSDASGAQMDLLRVGPQAHGYSAGWIDGRIVLNEPTPGQRNIAATTGSPGALSINEWLAGSGSSGSDWIELYNTDLRNPISLRDIFIGVSGTPAEITSPAFVAPGGFVRFFADKESGPNHLGFKLPAEGATLSLYDPTERLIDSVTFGAQLPGVSQGFYPDGTRNLVSFPLSSTPGKPNSLAFPISFALSAGHFVVEWSSVPARQYRIERSEDLTAWVLEKELTATGLTSSLEEAGQLVRAYYRVIALPAPP